VTGADGCVMPLSVATYLKCGGVVKNQIKNIAERE